MSRAYPRPHLLSREALVKVTPDTRHFTASMVVVDQVADAVLLVHHNASGKWVFPGGHVDPDEAMHEAALREVREETGIAAVLIYEVPVSRPGMTAHPIPFDIQEIAAPAKPKRPGKPAEPAHRHIDFLYVGLASSEVRTDFPADEVSQVRWVRFDNLAVMDGLRAEVRDVALAAWGFAVGQAPEVQAAKDRWAR